MKTVLILLFTLFPAILLSQDLSFFEYDWETAIYTTWGEGLPTQEKLEVFDTVWTMIDEEFGSFHNLDIYWDSIKEKYRPEIESGVSQGRFVAILNHMALKLKDTHTHFYHHYVNSTIPAPKTPLIYTGSWGEDTHFGAGLYPLPDSSLLVYIADENHPLGIKAGDIILGYEGVPWKKLYKILIEMEFPIGAPHSWGSNETAFTHSWLTGVGKNWHLFNSIDIIKYGTSDTIHLPTSTLVDADVSAVYSGQIPIPNIPYLDEVNHRDVSWGLVGNNNIGYIYTWSWYSSNGYDISRDFYNAIDSLINVYNVDGLILDMRVNNGGFVSESYGGLKLLFKEEPEYVALRRRANKEDRFDMQEYYRFQLYDDSTNYFHKPIAVLTSPLAASAGDIVPYILKKHPYVKVFGKTTASSLTTMKTLSYKTVLIKYALANGYLESDPLRYLNRAEFPVDFKVNLKADDVRFGIDTIVKEAINWIEDQIISSYRPMYTQVNSGFRLEQNYPNPFNPSTTIAFTLPKSNYVELKVYNILGKEVSQPVSNNLTAGVHQYQFDGSELASGVYYYQLVVRDFKEVKKMVLLR